MEKDETKGNDPDSFPGFLDRLLRFGVSCAEGILGRNPEAWEIGEKALEAYLLACLGGKKPERPYGWIQRVVFRLCCQGRRVFQARMVRLDGKEGWAENLYAEEGEDSETWEEVEWERETFLRVVFPKLTPNQQEAYLALREEGGIKPAARALGKKPANLRRTLRAIQEKARKLLGDVPPPHLRVEGKGGGRRGRKGKY